MSTLQERVDAQIVKLCAEQGLSQAELAKLVGRHSSSITRYEETGRRRHIFEMLEEIADALGCEIEIKFKHKKAGA